MKCNFTVNELISIKKALYRYNSYYTNEYKKNGRTLPQEYDEENTISAEMKTRIFLGEDKSYIQSLYGKVEK